MPHKLSLDLEEDEELAASVYGIISDLPAYRLAFMINQELGLRLKRCENDRKLYHKVGVVHYSEFHYHENLRMINWRLTANSRGLVSDKDAELTEPSAIPLVDALRSINFFLWYDEINIHELHKHIFEVLKPNPYIRAIQVVDVLRTRNIENLITEY